MNNAHCLECSRQIRVNMARHLRLMHTTYVCFWRCPVLSYSLWFTSELNTRDHIENIHHFREAHGTSFYECLRKYGLEWFGSRDFFNGRRQTSQALWVDLALARRSGQELRNAYIITKSPEYAPLRRFFRGRRRPLSFITVMLTSIVAMLFSILPMFFILILYITVSWCMVYMHECFIVITTISYVYIHHCHFILFMLDNSFYSYCLLFYHIRL